MRLLLDAHLSPDLARQLQRHGIDAVALRDWMGGIHRNSPDEQLLHAAGLDRRVLVTYDCHTIPPLICELAESGRHFSGVILVDEETVRPDDNGGLLRALLDLAAGDKHDDWEDRVLFLQAGRG